MTDLNRVTGEWLLLERPNSLGVEFHCVSSLDYTGDSHGQYKLRRWCLEFLIKNCSWTVTKSDLPRGSLLFRGNVKSPCIACASFGVSAPERLNSMWRRATGVGQESQHLQHGVSCCLLILTIAPHQTGDASHLTPGRKAGHELGSRACTHSNGQSAVS